MLRPPRFRATRTTDFDSYSRVPFLSPSLFIVVSILRPRGFSFFQRRKRNAAHSVYTSEISHFFGYAESRAYRFFFFFFITNALSLPFVLLKGVPKVPSMRHPCVIAIRLVQRRRSAYFIAFRLLERVRGYAFLTV